MVLSAQGREKARPAAHGVAPSVDQSAIQSYFRNNKQSALIRETETDAPIPLSLTVSGGVSLGSYQAGYLFYATEWLKRAPRFQVNLVTGASAGSINALLTVLALCDDAAQPDPEKSPFWQAWIPVGIKQLRNGSQSPLGLLNRDYLQRTADSLLETIWKRGPSRPCDMVLGLTGTRLTARTQELTHGMEAPKQKEKFIVHIQGGVAGQDYPSAGGMDSLGGAGPLEWKVSNYLVPPGHLSVPFLPFGRSGKEDRKALSQALFASASFPVAFPPQAVRLCLVDSALYEKAGGKDRKTGPDWDSLLTAANKSQCPDTTYFVDGGVLDNNPLGLAYKIAARGLQVDGKRLRWREKPAAGEGLKPPESLYFMYLDPDQSVYPGRGPGTDSPEGPKPFLPTYWGFALNFIAGARSDDLNALVEDVPSMSHRVGLTANYFPLMSDYLSAFFGFYEKEFRLFDYNMGMLDAFKYISEEVVKIDMKDAQGQSLNPRMNAAMASLMKGYGARFDCILAVLGPRDSASHEPLFGDPMTCKDPALRDFSILLQTSLDQFEAACAPLADSISGKVSRAKAGGGKDAAALNRQERHCFEYSPLFTTSVPGQNRLGKKDSSAFRTIKARKGSSAEIDALLFLLEARGFKYQDTKNGKTLSRNDLKMELHDDWEDMINELGNRQGGSWWSNFNPFSARNKLKIPAKPAVNLFHYVPPKTIFYLTFGVGGEGAVSWSVFPGMRFDNALQTKNLSSIFASGPAQVKLTPLLGLEYELPWNGAWLQWRLGSRFGLEYSRSAASDLGRGEFTDALKNERRVLQLVPSLSIYERFRAQLVGEWLAPLEKNEQGWRILFEIGGFQII
ncbi:MAG: hypothetical protein JWO30_2358 [Fibrobacteres bacterium]|nr:hypothetical protein [Fibrobacterota bacterium]